MKSFGDRPRRSPKGTRGSGAEGGGCPGEDEVSVRRRCERAGGSGSEGFGISCRVNDPVEAPSEEGGGPGEGGDSLLVESLWLSGDWVSPSSYG